MRGRKKMNKTRIMDNKQNKNDKYDHPQER